ncbi:hypothetical protein ABID34_003892 [Chryseobacterium limigenitum]
MEINYFFICPTMVVEGDADGNYLFQENYFPKSEGKQISAGNMGHFIAKEIDKVKSEIIKQYAQS